MDIEVLVESATPSNRDSISNSVEAERISLDSDNNISECDSNANIQDYSDQNSIPAAKIGLAAVIFTCISATIGILVVCLTSPRKTEVCLLNFKQTVQNSISYDAQPRSIAVGDFNMDNKLDIVAANSGKDNIGILFGDVNGTFISQVTYATGLESRPCSVVVNDFNKDNLLDIAVANYGTNSIGILLGNGNGTFANQTTFSTNSSRPLFINTGHFNNDSIVDIVVVNYGTHDITIFLGRGDATFANKISYSTGYDSIPYSLAVADFNNDKLLDIAVANYGTNNVAIFLGYGNGSFVRPMMYTTTPSSYPFSIAIADFNNDYQPDLVVANYGTGNIGIFFGYTNGTFAAQIMYPIGVQSRPQYVTIGDFNQDKLMDIVIVDATNGYVHVLPGFGNGSFSNITTYITGFGTSPFSAVVGDFDNDNQSDIAVTNYDTNDVLVLIGYSTKFAVTQTQYIVGRNSHPPSVALGDFNNDHQLDIVVAKFSSDSIGILIGYGNGSFATEIDYPIQNGSAQQCVCVGDFNSDGLSDIAVANYGTHNVGVLLGYGNGSFGTMATYPTGFEAFPIFVTVGDFNNDHVLDIAAANFRIDNVAILLGYGNGTFSKVVTYSTGGGSDPSALVVADFNNDTKLDLAVANSENSTVGILFGNGDGTFKTVITYLVGFQYHPDSISAGYLNNDSWLDIVVADSTSDTVAILLGYENGTFGKAVIYTDDSFSNPSGIVINDLNYDKILDIVVTNFGTDNVGILFGYGNGSFILGRTYQLSSGSDPKGIVLGDFNNNTRWDIVVTEFGIGSINLLVEYISANFRSVTTYSTGSASHPHSVTVGDFNNDNRSDIAVANSGGDDIGVFLGYGNGSFTPQTTHFVGAVSHPHYVAAGDFNKDNQLDIATANSGSDSVSVLFGYGNGSFANATIYSTKDASQPYWLASGDFNSDSRWDFVVANPGRDNIGILFGYDYAGFKSQQTYSNKNSLRPSSIIARDFNNDTYVDIAATLAADGSVGILFGFGNGSFREYVTYSVGSNSYPYEIVGGDVNNDNILDIAVANIGSSTLGVLLGYGNGTFAPVMTFSTGSDSRPYGAASGDFNNDNKLDFVVANYHSNSIGVLLGFGNGSFDTVVIYSTTDSSRPQSVAVGDFNKDGKKDIVVANYRRDNVGIFIGNGDGTFQNQIIHSSGYNSMPTFVIVDDFNNDNISDVAVSNKNNDNVGIFYGFGNGTFTAVALYSSGSGTSPQCIRSGDFNNDRAMDIAVVSPGTNYVLVLYGLGDGRFLLGPSYSTGSKAGPVSMAVGDFDSDGRLDIATANYLMNNIGVHISYGNISFGGITTFPISSGSEPASVAVSDFNKDGRLDVVVANFGTSTIAILLGDGNGAFASMVTYSTGEDSYSSAVAVGDITNDNHSDIVVTNTVGDNLYIFLGRGDGTFFLATIYPTGFHSFPYGLIICDFNNDHLLDIISVSSGSSNVLLLQGDGNGTFGNAMSYPMGYRFAPYAVAVADFNGDDRLDIAVANYDGDYIQILLNSC